MASLARLLANLAVWQESDGFARFKGNSLLSQAE
jgi:hypothetical protein